MSKIFPKPAFKGALEGWGCLWMDPCVDLCVCVQEMLTRGPHLPLAGDESRAINISQAEDKRREGRRSSAPGRQLGVGTVGMSQHQTGPPLGY